METSQYVKKPCVAVAHFDPSNSRSLLWSNFFDINKLESSSLSEELLSLLMRDKTKTPCNWEPQSQSKEHLCSRSSCYLAYTWNEISTIFVYFLLIRSNKNGGFFCFFLSFCENGILCKEHWECNSFEK